MSQLQQEPNQQEPNQQEQSKFENEVSLLINSGAMADKG